MLCCDAVGEKGFEFRALAFVVAVTAVTEAKRLEFDFVGVA